MRAVSNESHLTLISEKVHQPMTADTARPTTESHVALPLAQSTSAGSAAFIRETDAPTAPAAGGPSKRQQLVAALHLDQATALRSLLAISVLGGAGTGGFVLGGAGVSTATDEELSALESRMNEQLKDMDHRVGTLEPLIRRVDSTYEMSALALEISVESHRYLSDLIIDSTKLDHPDYSPPSEDVRLQRRLRRGEQVLDELDAPKAK